MSDKPGVKPGILSIKQVFSGQPIKIELPPVASADVATAERLERNLSILETLQPKIAQLVRSVPTPFQWVFARDGYLTARDGSAWWRGCSVPLLAGREMLKKLELGGAVGCFVCPSHAGEIRACFERLGANQAIIAVVPDPLTLAVIFHCDDFSAEIRAGRLIFAGGWDWQDQLTAIFEANPGLPTPQNFIRTILIDDEELNRFAAEAQTLISDQAALRTRRIALMRDSAERNIPSTGRVLVVASGLLRVSDLSGIALAATLCESESEGGPFPRLDPDRPMSASPVAVAQAATECDAIVTANTFRANFPGIVAANRPWITWVTLGPGCIVPPDPLGELDCVLLADPDWRQAARNRGWSDERIEIAGWPDRLGLFTHAEPVRGKYLGLMADVGSVEVPAELREVSSHRLLWELIGQELAASPLALGNDAGRYLETRMAKMGVSAEKFNFTLFFERLILPAYWAGLAKAAANEGLPLALIGRGWEKWPELADYARGATDSPATLTEQILECAAMIHPIPGAQAHSIDVLGRPVVQPGGLDMRQFLDLARKALAGKTATDRPTISPLSFGRVLGRIPSMRWPRCPSDPDRSCD